MEQLEQNILRFKTPAMALVGGTGAALVIATLPHVYLENIVGFTGLSEIISAAAPPLGNTARGLIAIMAGSVSASAIYFFLNRKGGSDMSVALREQINANNPIDPSYDPSADDGKRRFAMPKLSLNAKSWTRFLKKPKKVDGGPKKIMDLADLPMLREADAHPDAPARRPIFAESDLKSPLNEQIPPLEPEAPSEVIPDDSAASFTAERSITPPAEETPPIDPASANPQPAERHGAHSVPAPKLVDEQREDLSGYTIAQLADRLEAGLHRLNQIESAGRKLESMVVQSERMAPVAESRTDTPQEQPTVSQPPLVSVEKTEEQIQAERQADMDAALKAALGTLEKMTAQR